MFPTDSVRHLSGALILCVFAGLVAGCGNKEPAPAASGIAIFSAPMMVGLVASVSGVIGAWILVVAFLVAAVVVMRFIPNPARQGSAGDAETLERAGGGG